jgi:predicted ABC-class ATPase
MNGNKGALVEIDCETRSRNKDVEELLQVLGSNNVRTHEDDGVIGVLEHRARNVIQERVPQEGVLANQSLKNIGDKEEHVRGEGVSLP